MIPSTYYKQGSYVPVHKEKYTGTYPIFYRSNPEFLLMRWMDLNPKVIAWASESAIVNYKKPSDNKNHRYFIDFSCKFMGDSGKVVNLLIEYKPSKFVKKPEKTPRLSNKTYAGLCEKWIVNMAKWDAAHRYAKERGAKFVVITEKDLGLNNLLNVKKF